MIDYDAVDLRILATIQQNTDGTAGDVGERVGISANACWRRLRALQDSGTIMNRVALLSPTYLGCGLTAFVRCRAANVTAEWQAMLASTLHKMLSVTECYRLAGGADYRIKFMAADVAAMDSAIRDVCERFGFVVIDTEIAAQQVKYSTQIPLPATRE